MPREPQDDKKSGAGRRDARLKAALRENLRRRKAQARGRTGAATSPARETEPKKGPDGR